MITAIILGYIGISVMWAAHRIAYPKQKWYDSILLLPIILIMYLLNKLR